MCWLGGTAALGHRPLPTMVPQVSSSKGELLTLELMVGPSSLGCAADCRRKEVVRQEEPAAVRIRHALAEEVQAEHVAQQVPAVPMAERVREERPHVAVAQVLQGKHRVLEAHSTQLQTGAACLVLQDGSATSQVVVVTVQ